MDKSLPPKVSVICPFFNEELIIEAAVRRMLANLESQFNNEFELILVNDGSRDKSVERLLAVLNVEGAKDRVRVLSYPINQGRGRAVKLGINAASSSVIITTEVDCSWGDDIVGRLWAELDLHPEADFVIASPHCRGGRLINVAPGRIFLTRVGNWLIRHLFESSVTMNTGMTRAYRAPVIQPLLTEESGKEFHLEVLLKLFALGFRAREIPATLTWFSRGFGGKRGAKRRSSTPILRTINSHLRFIAIAQPVRHYAWLTLLSFAISLVFIAAAFAMLILGKVPAIYFALVGLIMLAISLLFGGLAILFYQLREIMRLKWMEPYAARIPPSARPAAEIFPLRRSS